MWTSISSLFIALLKDTLTDDKELHENDGEPYNV